jgi:uncharacterized repeat protein (TIGR03803 family)
VIYSFFDGNDGGLPLGSLILDAVGNLYGTTNNSFFFNYGTVFQLTPSGSGWTENTLYSFTDGNDGGRPIGGVILDGSGNLFGTTSFAGSGQGGTVFELTPLQGGWMFNLLQSFTGYQEQATGPHASLFMDTARNLYGTTYGIEGGPDYGTVFQLTPTGNGWMQTVLHSFTGSDGELPISNVIFDGSGNMFGTASQGGGGAGVVWEIIP